MLQRCCAEVFRRIQARVIRVKPFPKRKVESRDTETMEYSEVRIVRQHFIERIEQR